MYLVMLDRAPAALTVVMKREFHQVLHAYKLHLLKFEDKELKLGMVITV